MNITRTNNMTDAMSAASANKSSQDSHEKSIQNQITSLQGKLRDIANNATMSTDEKSDAKKKLQEKIQNLNSELKQYQIQKRREESEKRRTETDKNDENAKKSTTGRTDSNDNDTGANTANAIGNGITSDGTDNTDSVRESGISSAGSGRNTDSQTQQDKQAFGLDGAETEMMVSFSNTRKQFANMEKIQTNLTGLMRTAETDEEKLKIQKKIDSVSNIIEDKALKASDKLKETREEEKAKKKKIREMLKEQETRRANMKAAVPKSGKSVFGDNEYGKVLLTRKKYNM